MASISDVFNALNDIKGKLDALHADGVNLAAKQDVTNTRLTTLDQTVTNVGAALGAQLGQVLQQQLLGLQLVHHISRQQETVICILEHISVNTCALVNLTTEELAALKLIQESARVTAEVSEFANPAAALDLSQRDAMRKQLEECCPPRVPAPPCGYKPCDNPGTFKGVVEPRKG